MPPKRCFESSTINLKKLIHIDKNKHCTVLLARVAMTPECTFTAQESAKPQLIFKFILSIHYIYNQASIYRPQLLVKGYGYNYLKTSKSTCYTIKFMAPSFFVILKSSGEIIHILLNTQIEKYRQ